MRLRRPISFAVVGGLLAGLAAGPARADNEPVIVVPGRAGVPVMMYGIDVSGAVIEGEWGLNRPGVVAPTVIMRYWPQGYYEAPGGYFPATGQRPRYGRHEVIPPANRRLPPRAESFHRSWGIESPPSPATMSAPYEQPQINVAPVMPHRRSHRESMAHRPAPSHNP